MKSARIAVVCLAALLLAAPAFAGNKGANLFALEFASGTADLYFERNTNYISEFDHSELGVQGQAWHLMTDDYALAVSAGIGFFGETDKPGNGAPSGAEDFQYTQSSWNVRLGMDRFFSLGEKGLFYAGPGLQYWSGKSKYDYGSNDPANWESQNVGRISFNGRIGALYNLNDTVGLGGHIGHNLGMASATDEGRKLSAWASSMEAAGGLVFGFGK